MKTKLILRTTGLFILICSLLIIYSCSKSQNAGSSEDLSGKQDKNTEEITVDEKDFTESDNDLATIDYKEIYEKLSPHGEWLQISPEEIGLKPETAFIEERDNKGLSLSDVIGVKVANATVVNEEMVYVWKPSLDLGVMGAAGEAKVYVPYTNGQWVNSDAGWYFKAPTPVEETVSHYGRWVNSPEEGWLWVPGRVFSPAWVDWKQNDNYVSWAPLPPSVYLNDGIISPPVIADNNYVIVENKNFLEPDVYKYNTVYYNGGSPVSVNTMTRTKGVEVVNNTVVNRGPDVNLLQALFGRNIEVVKLQPVVNYNEVRYTEKEYIVYKPVFKRFKNKDNKRVRVNSPGSYKKYEEWTVRKYKVTESGPVEINKTGKGDNGNDKNYSTDKKNNNNNSGNKNNEINNGSKKNDDNGKGNKKSSNDSNKDKEKNKGKKQNDKDNNNSNNGNDKGNDNGKGKK